MIDIIEGSTRAQLGAHRRGGIYQLPGEMLVSQCQGAGKAAETCLQDVAPVCKASPLDADKLASKTLRMCDDIKPVGCNLRTSILGEGTLVPE